MPRKGENIYKRKDGRWEGSYIKARSKTGKAVYGYVYAPTYKEAKRKRSQAIINIEANQTTIRKVPETTMPTCFIRKLANDWMNSIQSQIKKSSYVKYYNILHTYILPEFDNVPLSELTSSPWQFIRRRTFTKDSSGYSVSDEKSAQICPDSGISAAKYRKGDHHPPDCAGYSRNSAFLSGHSLPISLCQYVRTQSWDSAVSFYGNAGW